MSSLRLSFDCIVCAIKNCFTGAHTHRNPRTGRCRGAGGGVAGGPLAGRVAYGPLHGAGRLGGAVGVGGAGGPLQRLVQQEGLLLHVVALTAAAVGVARVVGLGVVL